MYSHNRYREIARRHARYVKTSLIRKLDKSLTAEERREWWSDSGRYLEAVVPLSQLLPEDWELGKEDSVRNDTGTYGRLDRGDGR